LDIPFVAGVINIGEVVGIVGKSGQTALRGIRIASKDW